MKKFFQFITIIACFVMMLSILTACNSDKNKLNENVVTFTDALGREVTIPKEPERVAALIGSFADVWMLAGGSVCATAEDAEFYAEKLSDEYLANFAARSLATLKGSEPVVKSLIENQGENGLSKKLLAQIASYKHIPAVEGTLLEWLEGATEEETAQINLALASCGSADAVKTLAAAAADANYAFEGDTLLLPNAEETAIDTVVIAD